MQAEFKQHGKQDNSRDGARITEAAAHPDIDADALRGDPLSLKIKSKYQIQPIPFELVYGLSLVLPANENWGDFIREVNDLHLKVRNAPLVDDRVFRMIAGVPDFNGAPDPVAEKFTYLPDCYRQYGEARRATLVEAVVGHAVHTLHFGVGRGFGGSDHVVLADKHGALTADTNNTLIKLWNAAETIAARPEESTWSSFPRVIRTKATFVDSHVIDLREESSAVRTA